jgi:hypothetical protein
MCLGVVDVIAFINHATFPQDSKLIKLMASKALMRITCIIYPLALEKTQKGF